MAIDGKRVAILAENLYEDLELWYPLMRMKEAGAKVTVVGSGSSPSFKSKHGYEVKVDIAAEKADAREFDAVIIPGGFAPDYLRRYPSVLKFVRDAYEGGKIVAAICHAGSVLISAGIIRGRKATCYRSIKEDMVNAGAQYVDMEVVRDGNMITSRFPDDLPAFCKEIIAALEERTPEIRAGRAS